MMYYFLVKYYVPVGLKNVQQSVAMTPFKEVVYLIKLL